MDSNVSASPLVISGVMRELVVECKELEYIGFSTKIKWPME